MDADLFIAPSNDWTEVREMHQRMHVLRAIEQGFTLFRPTKDGVSVAADPYGRVLARLDTEVSPEKVMVVSLPACRSGHDSAFAVDAPGLGLLAQDSTGFALIRDSHFEGNTAGGAGSVINSDGAEVVVLQRTDSTPRPQ
jgi:hypothetical protein